MQPCCGAVAVARVAKLYLMIKIFAFWQRRDSEGFRWGGGQKTRLPLYNFLELKFSSSTLQNLRAKPRIKYLGEKGQFSNFHLVFAWITLYDFNSITEMYTIQLKNLLPTPGLKIPGGAHVKEAKMTLSRALSFSLLLTEFILWFCRNSEVQNCEHRLCAVSN